MVQSLYVKTIDEGKSSLQSPLTLFKNNRTDIRKKDKDWTIKKLKKYINEFGDSFPDSNAAWPIFINNIIYNDNALEGLNVPERKVSQIVTDLRVKKGKSKYYNSKKPINKELSEIAGHATMYDYVLNSNDKIGLYSIKKLHGLLFQFSPHPECAGVFRQCNNRINGSKVETADHTKIYEKMFLLNQDVDTLIMDKDNLSFSDYIDGAINIHHEIVMIHPFVDGNGRVARAFLNWLLKAKGLPPVYIKVRYKQEYCDAMEKAYTNFDYKSLQLIYYKGIMSSLIQLNELDDIEVMEEH